MFLQSLLFSKVTTLIARHALTAAGAVLVAEGHTDAAAWEVVSGGAMAALGIGLSVAQKAMTGQITLRF